MDATQKEVLRFRGVAHFRQRLVFATLAKRRLRIDGIRDKEESPGLRPFEASFLRLLEKLTNGCRIEINETGTTLKYVPGWIVGGTLEHDCGVGRSIGWFLEGILPLVPFGKKAAALTLTGSTSDDTDVSVDLLKTVHLPTLTHFGISDGLRLDILARGCPPNGGGRVLFACPVMRELQPISLTEEGFIKRIRGLSYTCKVSPQLSNRIVEAARGVINPLLADVYVFTDHRKGADAGSSPGYGVSLVAMSTSGCVYGAQACTGSPPGLAEGSESAPTKPPRSPEDLGRSAATALLETIARGGCIDEQTQSLVFTLMLLGPEDVSRVRVGSVSPSGIATLRLLRDVWGVSFKLTTEAQVAAPSAPKAVPEAKRRKRTARDEDDDDDDDDEEEEELADAGESRKRGDKAERAPLTAGAGGGYSAASTVLVSCLGLGFNNMAKKVT